MEEIKQIPYPECVKYCRIPVDFGVERCVFECPEKTKEKDE